MLRQASKRNAQAIGEGRVRLQLGSATALPFEEALFDKALSANSLPFWPDQEAGVKEMWRVLQPGRVIAIILQPRWARTEGEVKQIGEGLAALLSKVGFQQARLEFKPMKPIASVRAWHQVSSAPAPMTFPSMRAHARTRSSLWIHPGPLRNNVERERIVVDQSHALPLLNSDLRLDNIGARHMHFCPRPSGSRNPSCLSGCQNGGEQIAHRRKSKPSRGTVNFIWAQLYTAVNTSTVFS
jgi:SAM-dependent methyltransferase